MKSLKKKVWVVMLCLAGLIAPVGLGGFDSVCTAAEVVKSKDANEKERAGEAKERPRFALVIGNAKYKGVPALENPSNDTEDMMQSLNRLGFKVTHLLDVQNRRKMTAAVRKFGDHLAQNPDAIGMFFYAGHAIQINGVNYLIPVEAEIKSEADVEFETFDINYLLRTMSQAKNGMNIVVLDACRNNPFARGFRGTTGRGLATMRSPTGSTIVFATAPGENAEDGSDRNGTFTKHLLQHIETPNLTIEQMLKKVRLGVHDETNGQQIPWLESSQLGDFCFAGCLDQAALELEAMRQAEEKLKNKIEEEQEKLDKERSAWLAEQRAMLEKKQADVKTKADGTLQPQEQESLAKIQKEQEALAEQRRLLKKEQERIDKQNGLLAQQKKASAEQQKELSRLKKEQEKKEKEREKLAQFSSESGKTSRPSKQAQNVGISIGAQRIKPVMPTIGF